MTYRHVKFFLFLFFILSSEELKCKMNFAIYLPPQAENEGAKLPVLYWLSGLTCTEKNYVEKVLT